MAALPLEVISEIFTYLSVEDCKSCSLVCSLWFNAFLDPYILKRLCLNLTPHDIGYKTLTCLRDRRLTELHLHHLTISKNCQQFLSLVSDSLTENIHHLTISQSELTDSALLMLLRKCSRLTSLNFSRCDNMFMTQTFIQKLSSASDVDFKFDKLTTLAFHSICYLTDAVLLNFTGRCPNLTDLTVSACKITTVTNTYDNTDKESYSPSQKVMLNFVTIVNYVKEYAKQIKCLNFSRTTITDDILNELSSIEHLQLTSISLSHCSTLTDKSIKALCCSQTCLESLDLSGNLTLTTASLAYVTANLKQLKSLKLEQCRQLRGNAVKALSALHSLTELNLSGLYLCSVVQMSAALFDTEFINLRHLNLAKCNLITDDFVLELCTWYPRLRSLTLNTCPIADVAVTFVCTFLTELRYLDVSWCQKLTDLAFTGMFDYNTCDAEMQKTKVRLPLDLDRRTVLKVLQPMSLLQRSDNVEVDNSADNKHLLTDVETKALCNLQLLEYLDISNCSKLTDNCALSGALKLPNLTTFKAKYCAKLTDATVERLSTDCRQLRCLDLNNCTNFSDRGMFSISEGLPRLRELHISNCDLVTFIGLQALSQKCTLLRVLDVTYCNNLDNVTIDQTENKLQHLHTVKRKLAGRVRNK